MNTFARAARLLNRFFSNRYVITVVLITVSIFAWKLHVHANNDGYITGMVVDETGKAVAGATVFLQERNLVIVETPMTVQTDKNGRFVFEGMSLVSFFIWVEKDGYAKPNKDAHHLYFKKQNFTLSEPLVLARE